MGTIYHVAILVLQSSPLFRIGNWISVMSRGKGQAPLRFETLYQMPRDYTLWATPDAAGPVLTYVRGLIMPEHKFLGPYRPIIEAPHSNNHKGEKYINVRAGESLTPQS